MYRKLIYKNIYKKFRWYSISNRIVNKKTLIFLNKNIKISFFIYYNNFNHKFIFIYLILF